MIWTDEIKNNFKSFLKETVVTVTFTKTNGEERTMLATLNPEAFKDYSYSGKGKAENPDICAVWDTEINEWRSFRYDSVNSFSLTLS